MTNKMENFLGHAVNPESVVCRIISRIYGTLSPQLKARILAKDELPINDIDAKKLATYSWNMLTLEQLMYWLQSNGSKGIVKAFKIRIVGIILEKDPGKKFLKIDKYSDDDLSHRSIISGNRADDLICYAEVFNPENLEKKLLDFINSQPQSKVLKITG